MSNTYTPGPWVCHSGMVYKDGPNVWPKGNENGIPIARMDREPDNGTFPVERDANARLIAAAPELLEALKEYDEAVRNKIGIIPELRASYAKVVAALAKAEGRD